MERGKLILITGGARSGKSRLAEEMAASLSSGEGTAKRVIYLATAEVKDEEMEQRIRRHRQRRPAHWQTIEESYAPEAVIREQGPRAAVILLDCLTLLLTNWLLPAEEESEEADWSHFAEKRSEKLLQQMAVLAETAWQISSHVIMVTNEVGQGLVPENPLGRLYRDLLGLSNQIVAGQADEVYAVWSGIPLKIKG